jgi:hypothetical protein
MKLRLLPSPTPATIRFMLKVLGVIILVAGLSTAASIWLTQDRIDKQSNAGEADITGPLSPEDSRRYTHDVEVYYGQTGLLMEKWRRWWEEWTQGKHLAELIAVAAVLSASGLFSVSRDRRWPTKSLNTHTGEQSDRAPSDRLYD